LTSRFRELTVMPAPDVDQIEALNSGWIQRQIDRLGGTLDARLAKRYAVPFGGDPTANGERSDVPLIIEDWLTALVTIRAYAKRGFNPSSGDTWFEETVAQPARDAAAQIAEAANSETALFELPLLESTAPDGSALTRAGPLAYTERSPYVWQDVERDAALEEDSNGEGTIL